MILKSFGSLSFNDRRDRAPGSSPPCRCSCAYVNRAIRLRVCRTTPAAVSHSDSGTFHVCAAAVTSIARAAAPTWRIGTQFVGVAVLPPALWLGYFVVSNRRLLDAHVLPVDVQLLGDQHREHRLHALTDLRILGDDRDDAVGRDADERVRREFRGARAADRRRERFRRLEQLDVAGEQHAAAGDGGDAKEGAAIDAELS